MDVSCTQIFKIKTFFRMSVKLPILIITIYYMAPFSFKFITKRHAKDREMGNDQTRRQAKNRDMTRRGDMQKNCKTDSKKPALASQA